ncbi:MAG: aldehyde ferredoxin oxidoreductase family protein [Desulfatiglandales bacterium]
MTKEERKFLVINLTSQDFKEHKIDEKELRKYLGGSGIAAWYLYQNLNPSVQRLDSDNPLFFFPGLLTGTPIPTASKTSVCGRSPLTGIWNEATVGGQWGAALKKNGYEGIIIKGKAAQPVYLYINSDGVTFEDAQTIWGLDTYKTSKKIEKNHPRVQIASIGQAGENLVPISAIVFDAPHCRLAGRGGMGALMGSKNLKAVAVEKEKKPLYVSDQEGLRKSVKELTPSIRAYTQGLHNYGTGGSVEAREYTGDLPIKNFAQSRWSGATKTTGQAIAETIFKKHYACYYCPIACGKEVTLKEEIVHGPEYETLSAFGSNLLNDNLDSIVLMNDLCNCYGIDTISLGVSIAFAIEAFEEGLLKKEDLHGIHLNWGNSEAFIALTHQVAHNEKLGKLIGLGVKALSEQLGEKTKEYALHTKGLEYPMHDPRAYTGMALSYATANRGACHLESLSYVIESGLPATDLGYDDKNMLDPHSSENKAELVVKLQDYMNVLNALGLCKFLLAGRIGPKIVSEWLSKVTGWDVDQKEIMQIGQRLHNLKRLYNVKLGISSKDDTVPPRILNLARTGGLAEGILPDINHMLTEYYQIRDWDAKGITTEDKIKELELNSI